MLHTSLMADVAEAQRRDLLTAAERHRQVVKLYEGQPPLARRAATPLGRALIYLGAGLLRYGRAEKPSFTRRYRASSRSVGMN
ncbi:MAG TPA: hypothetical protein VFX76_15300 [Roseiflexaceae bacterium]|nr:hypothetical protein [Roseiflexaceae bacterium]